MKRRIRPSLAPSDGVSPPLLLRIGMVVRVTGLGRSTIYRMMAKADFPSPVRLNNRVVAWRRTDLEKWTETRPINSH